MIDPLHFIDSAPRSRNERLGAEMRTIGICQERGSGWDKVTFEVEFHQLPPPLVEVKGEQTRVTIFAPQPLTQMDRPERLRAMYQHACLRFVSNQPTNNTTVRKRFGIADRNKALASSRKRWTRDSSRPTTLLLVPGRSVTFRSGRTPGADC